MKWCALLLCLLSVIGISNAQERYSILIDEIMADPTPQVSLPANEWIELKNVSANPVNLQGWRIGDLSGQSGPLPVFILQPDSCVIICTGTAVAGMSAYGAVIAVTSFPSLDNDGDELFLRAASGKIIHAVGYSSNWYRNELKKEGGWSLEMIDPGTPCSGPGNWTASTNMNGATPGRRNSVDAIYADDSPPRLLHSYTMDSVTIILVFDEPLDSLIAATISNYTIDGGLTITSAITVPPLFNKVSLKPASPLLPNKVYTVAAHSLIDCEGNTIGSKNSAKTGLASDPLPGDWIVNEILFNPRPNAYDYVEFFNPGNKIVDISKLFIANRNSSGTISSLKPLSPVPMLVFPGEWIAVTEDPVNLSQHYLLREPDRILALSSMPSFPDDEGVVVAVNSQGMVVDEVRYVDDWHFKLIDDVEGISLERIDPGGGPGIPGNWHSAASTAGYGTPGYRNSQYRNIEPVNTVVESTPKIFSPDNDGRDDFLLVSYEVGEPGWVANITVFNAAGRAMRRLVRNGLMGNKGYWTWDGLDDNGKLLPIGVYIVFVEIFDLAGHRKQSKQAVVLARPLK